MEANLRGKSLIADFMMSDLVEVNKSKVKSQNLKVLMI
jgi:hypothetical protein